MSATLLIEIGCEEIPARMIEGATRDLAAIVTGILDKAGLARGEATSWGGPRRIAVLVASVAARQEDREETVQGPAASVAFDKDGKPTPAGAGFAKKQGVDPSALTRLETEKGTYAGFTRRVTGKSLGDVLAAALPAAVASMSFPKTMRWGSGEHRWVRPVHTVVCLHGAEVLDVTILGARSGRASLGHRFLAAGEVAIARAEDYVSALRGAKVVVDPKERRETLQRALHAAAQEAGGALVPDEALLDEVADLVEWPGVVTGRFDPSFLKLPREILVTTLRHHQKSFSVQSSDGLLPAFLAVADTDRDPGGHVRRGNEWVVVGRLTDARFFWEEDRKRPLADRTGDLERVVFHKKLGSYAEKVRRVGAVAEAIAAGLSEDVPRAVRAASLSKCDLVTGLVGEFPELQGIVGGLLLRAEGEDEAVARAVAEHYRPATADDAIPRTNEGAIVAVADRLDTIRGLLEAGEAPTGSRDPFGLRRAASSVFRILAERPLPLTMSGLFDLTGRSAPVVAFLDERLNRWLEERGSSPNEVWAVRRQNVSTKDFEGWTLPQILRRLDVVKTLRGREDFARLVELTKRVDNILVKQGGTLEQGAAFRETAPAALALTREHDDVFPRIVAASERSDFQEVVDLLSRLVPPVSKFFDDVLVLDPNDAAATRSRCRLLANLRSTVTRDFDIRELAGQADAKR